jgi:hypothetical protein
MDGPMFKCDMQSQVWSKPCPPGQKNETCIFLKPANDCVLQHVYLWRIWNRSPHRAVLRRCRNNKGKCFDGEVITLVLDNSEPHTALNIARTRSCTLCPRDFSSLSSQSPRQFGSHPPAENQAKHVPAANVVLACEAAIHFTDMVEPKILLSKSQIRLYFFLKRDSKGLWHQTQGAGEHWWVLQHHATKRNTRRWLPSQTYQAKAEWWCQLCAITAKQFFCRVQPLVAAACANVSEELLMLCFGRQNLTSPEFRRWERCALCVFWRIVGVLK